MLFVRSLLACVVALVLPSAAHAQTPRVLDPFETLTPWTADASTDVSSTITAVDGHDGRAMRLTYDFNGRSGYAFAARALDLDVPDNYEISFWLRGEMRPNTLEIKFVDASGVRNQSVPPSPFSTVARSRQVSPSEEACSR